MNLNTKLSLLLSLLLCGCGGEPTPEDIFSEVIEVASNYESDDDGKMGIFDENPYIQVGVWQLSGNFMALADGSVGVTYDVPLSMGGGTASEFASLTNIELISADLKRQAMAGEQYYFNGDQVTPETELTTPSTGKFIQADFAGTSDGVPFEARFVLCLSLPNTLTMKVLYGGGAHYISSHKLPEEKFLKVAELLQSDMSKLEEQIDQLAEMKKQLKIQEEKEEKAWLAREEEIELENKKKAAEEASLLAQKETEAAIERSLRLMEAEVAKRKEAEAAIAKKKAEELAEKQKDEATLQLANEIKSLKLSVELLPKAMQQRTSSSKRASSLRSGGGASVVEAAVIRGLDWLKNNQEPEGSWGGHDKNREGELQPTDKDAMTSMALLCFLGHGELPDSVNYGSAIEKAILFLLSTPPDKPIKSKTACYSHPIRTYALCETYAMTKNKRLEEFTKRAIEHVIKGQNENGGWAYGYNKGPTAHTDLSLTSWNISAIKAASLTGIKIEGLKEAMEKATNYVKECQARDGRFSYRRGGSGKPSLTGAGVFCLQSANDGSSIEAKQGLEWIIANQKKAWEEVDLYEWYYHTQACFHATGMPGGSKYWTSWNKDFQQILCRSQAADGHWPPGKHFFGDTDIFRTTLAILTLEVYYRYMP